MRTATVVKCRFDTRIDRPFPIMNAVVKTFYIVIFLDLCLDLHCIALDVIQLSKLCIVNELIALMVGL